MISPGVRVGAGTLVVAGLGAWALVSNLRAAAVPTVTTLPPVLHGDGTGVLVCAVDPAGKPLTVWAQWTLLTPDGGRKYLDPGSAAQEHQQFAQLSADSDPTEIRFPVEGLERRGQYTLTCRARRDDAAELSRPYQANTGIDVVEGAPVQFTSEWGPR